MTRIVLMQDNGTATPLYQGRRSIQPPPHPWLIFDPTHDGEPELVVRFHDECLPSLESGGDDVSVRFPVAPLVLRRALLGLSGDEAVARDLAELRPPCRSVATEAAADLSRYPAEPLWRLKRRFAALECAQVRKASEWVRGLFDMREAVSEGIERYGNAVRGAAPASVVVTGDCREAVVRQMAAAVKRATHSDDERTYQMGQAAAILGRWNPSTFGGFAKDYWAAAVPQS